MHYTKPSKYFSMINSCSPNTNSRSLHLTTRRHVFPMTPFLTLTTVTPSNMITPIFYHIYLPQHPGFVFCMPSWLPPTEQFGIFPFSVCLLLDHLVSYIFDSPSIDSKWVPLFQSRPLSFCDPHHSFFSACMPQTSTSI